MIVVDASALLAILLDEPEGRVFREFLLSAKALTMSPVGYWEAATRLRSLRGDQGIRELDTVVEGLRIAVTPATNATARLASETERRYGKRTAARLNLGDCFAYALASEQGAPLLYKGDDFASTDIKPALPA